MPEFLFPLGRHFLELEEFLGFAEAGARRDGGPEAGVVGAEAPGGGATHAEAADEGAVLVDRVLAFHGIEGFEEIDFAGEAVGVAEAAVEVQHDGVARREFAGGALAAGKEVDFAEGFVAAVKPGIHAPAMGRRRRVRGRDDEAVRLNALIDFRNVAAHYESGGGGPRRLAFGQLGGAGFALLQEGLGGGDFGGLKEFVVLERVADGLVIDQHVGQQRAALQFIDGGAQVSQSGLELGAIGGGNFDANGGDGFDSWLGDSRNREQKYARQRSHIGSHYATTQVLTGLAARILE